jgi:hypothetical protein
MWPRRNSRIPTIGRDSFALERKLSIKDHASFDLQDSGTYRFPLRVLLYMGHHP